MQLYKKIVSHLTLLQEMEKAGVADAFLKDCGEEELLSLSQGINQLDAKEEISGMETKAVKYLIHDQAFLPYLVRLLRADICGPARAGKLLADAGDDLLSESYSYEEIVSVLADQRIETCRTYVYLKYFASVPYSETEKEYLMYGLDALDQCEELSVDALTDTGRNLLMEPAVSSILLPKIPLKIITTSYTVGSASPKAS